MQMASGICHSVSMIPEERGGFFLFFFPLPTSVCTIPGKASHWFRLGPMPKPGSMIVAGGLRPLTSQAWLVCPPWCLGWGLGTSSPTTNNTEGQVPQRKLLLSRKQGQGCLLTGA